MARKGHPTWTPDPARPLPATGISGNAVNGLGETAERRQQMFNGGNGQTAFAENGP